MMKALAALLLPVASAAPLPGDVQQWAGTISFDDPSLQTSGAPLNVTLNAGIDKSSASFTWHFTAEACRRQLEPLLVWSTNASGGASAVGDGAAGSPNFYSFVGTLDAEKSTLSGQVIHPPFAARKRAANSGGPGGLGHPPCRGPLGPYPDRKKRHGKRARTSARTFGCTVTPTAPQ
jgi:hypothetical protein